MAVYIGIYSVLSIIGLSAGNKRSLWAFLVVGLFLVLFMGLRYEVGCDFAGYLHRFSFSHADVLDGMPFVTNEWGFKFLTYAVQELTGSYAVFLTVISAILVSCYVIFARAFHGSFAILALLFPIIIVQLGMSGVRQALAGGFLMLAGVAFINGRRWLVAVCILIGFQFHSSVIVFLPIAFLAGREISTGRLLAVLLFVAPVSGLLLADRFDSYSDRYIEQIYGEQDARGGVIRYGLVMIPMVAFAFWGKFIRRDFPKVFPLLKLFALIGFSIAPLLLLSTVALHRFNYYVMPFSILVFQYLALSAVKPHNRIKAQAVPFVLYGLYSISWFSLSAHADRCYIPYKNWIFMS